MSDALSMLLALLPLGVALGIYLLADKVQEWVRFGVWLGLIGLVLWAPRDEAKCLTYRQGIPGGGVINGVQVEAADASDCNNLLGADMWGTIGKITSRDVAILLPLVGPHVPVPAIGPPATSDDCATELLQGGGCPVDTAVSPALPRQSPVPISSNIDLTPDLVSITLALIGLAVGGRVRAGARTD